MSATDLTLFLGGDVMTGRGVDQIFPDACAPALYEPYVESALDYVELAEAAHGPIPRHVDGSYVWGDALEILERQRPDARVVNLETAVTTSDAAEPKGINYRMHPRNVGVLTAAHIDCCTLANNHVMDWGEPGLIETLDTLAGAGVHVSGAGRDLAQACLPAVLNVGEERRVLVFALGAEDSGIPPEWAADRGTPGVHLLRDFSHEQVTRIARLVAAAKRTGDVAVLSVHWGPNWGYGIHRDHRRLAHALIDDAAVDVVHGHSSHHPKAIEIHHGCPIFYGCGDLVTDYEGISGSEKYRGDLSLMYFVGLDAHGHVTRLVMSAVQMRRFRLMRPEPADHQWLCDRMNRECRKFGHAVARRDDLLLELLL